MISALFWRNVHINDTLEIMLLISGKGVQRITILVSVSFSVSNFTFFLPDFDSILFIAWPFYAIFALHFYVFSVFFFCF